MGTTTVTRTAPACSEKELNTWYQGELAEMARESGTDAYSGNWNANRGFSILAQSVKTDAEAEQVLERHLNKWGAVVAVRVGDFTKAFPASKGDQALVAKLEELRTAVDLFDWHVLDRAHKAKSKTRKCGHCESGINVHKMHKPTMAEYQSAESGSWDWPGVFRSRGVRYVPVFRALTDCPVCGKNLLKTETDEKSFKSLQTRLAEAQKRVSAAQAAHKEKMAGKPAPHWYVSAYCGC